jgi:hypothetical protein
VSAVSVEAAPGAGKGSVGPMLPGGEEEAVAAFVPLRSFGNREARSPVGFSCAQSPAESFGLSGRDRDALAHHLARMARTGALLKIDRSGLSQDTLTRRLRN